MASQLIAHVAAWYIPTGQPLVNDMDGLTIDGAYRLEAQRMHSELERRARGQPLCVEIDIRPVKNKRTLDQKRKITITLTFAPDDYRQQIGMDAQAKTTLAPIQPVRTSLCITKARDGSLLLAEMTPQVPGQVNMDGDETPMPAMARVGRAGY